MATEPATAHPTKILLIHFGQLGDVVLSLPAIRAVRQRFSGAKITVAVGKSCAAVIELAGVADERIVVDRVELRDGNRVRSILEIVRLVRDVRRRKFDFVIDLHSLSETNILGFLSGANIRLYSNRKNRSLDFLSTLSAPKEDKQQHAIERYLDVLKPLGIGGVSRAPDITPRAKDVEFVENLWRAQALAGVLVGLFPGAGHESRRWNLDNFATLAAQLTRNARIQVAVFLGPEEAHLAKDVRARFPEQTPVFDSLTLFQFVAALARLSVFVSNDTGPVHLAAAVGTPIVVVLDAHAPTQYLPLVEHIRAVNSAPISEIGVGEVYSATLDLLGLSRVRSEVSG
jgi:ADP-heptose:LPS heptosyltransferase